jgi:hypothetical protein
MGESMSDNTDETPFRGIVKDAYDTRDENDPSETRLEIATWKVEYWSPDDEPDDEEEEPIKDDEGTLRYTKILDFALDELGAEEIARRTALKSYRDDRGGRAESTIRGYRQNPQRLAPKEEGGLPSSHPVKRVLRRYARSQDLGHFEDDKSTDKNTEDDTEGGIDWFGMDDDPVARKVEEAEPIDMEALKSAFTLARSIASQNGFVFAPRSGEPVAVEDNERIDEGEIRRHDRPVGEVKAACLLEKPGGATYEYRIDLDDKSLERMDNAGLPPNGWGR